MQLISASQISVFELCPRKWAWRYLEKKEAPPNKWAQRGIDIHQYLADWFSKGTLPPKTAYGHVAIAILQQLPPPQTPNLVVEHHFQFDCFQGYIDLAVFEPNYCFVADHKTTSDFRYALTYDNIVHDAQAALYAEFALRETQQDTCTLQWTYGRTRGRPTSLVIKRIVNKSDIESRTQKNNKTAKIILDLYLNPPKIWDIPYNATACDAYGGCVYRKDCQLTPREKLRSIMSQDAIKSDFLQRLKSNVAAQNNEEFDTDIEEEEEEEEPEPAPEPPKKRRKRRTKAEMAAARAAGEVPFRKPQPPINPPLPKESKEQPAPAPMASESVLSIYTRGFKDGFKIASELFKS